MAVTGRATGLQRSGTYIPEALLVATLRRWQRHCEAHAFVFEPDTRHTCWNETSPPTITCFSKALRFYGCVKCGRSHHCRSEWRGCIKVLTPAGEYACVFSGLQFPAEMSIGKFDEECRVIASRRLPSLADVPDTRQCSFTTSDTPWLKIKETELAKYDRMVARQAKRRSDASAVAPTPAPAPMSTHEEPRALDEYEILALEPVGADTGWADDHGVVDDTGGGSGGGGGGGDGDGERYTALSSADARLSGVSTDSMYRTNVHAMRVAHDVGGGDESKQRYYERALEKALEHFDREHAEQADWERETTEAHRTQAPEAGAVVQIPATPPQSAVKSRRDYARSVRQALHDVQSDIRAIVNVLGGGYTMVVRTELVDYYYGVARTLFMLMLRRWPLKTPVTQRRLGVVLMLDLLVRPLVMSDGTRRQYKILVWNEDPWLGPLVRHYAITRLFIQEVKQQSPQQARQRKLAAAASPAALALPAHVDTRNVPRFERKKYNEWLKSASDAIRLLDTTPAALRASLFS